MKMGLLILHTLNIREEDEKLVPDLVKLDGIVILQFHPFDLQTLMKSTDTVCIDDNIVDFPFANCFTGGFRVTVSVRPSLNWVLS